MRANDGERAAGRDSNGWRILEEWERECKRREEGGSEWWVDDSLCMYVVAGGQS